MRAAVIVCPGPSLDPNDIPHLHEQVETVVAVNRAYKAWADYPNLNPHMIYAMDGTHRFKEHERAEIRETDSLIVTRKEAAVPARWKSAIGDPKRVRSVEIEKQSGENLDPLIEGKIYAPRLTTLFAWQDLIQLGYDALFFYGCDCHCRNRQQYWFDDPTSRDEYAKRYRANHNVQYAVVADVLKKWVPIAASEHGVLTFNLSPKSLLGDFIPTIEIGEIARWIFETS